MININRQATVTIEYIGQEKTPIIVIDDYMENLEQLVNKVTEHSRFKPDEVTKYPGIRSPIPKGLVVEYLKPLMEVLYKVYNLPDVLQPAPIDNYFSLLTTQPNELSAMQTWPHFDTPNPNLIAIIHYLNQAEHGGTAFFRHNKSGLDRIDDRNKDCFFKYAHDYFQSPNANAFSYCDEKNSEFTCYKRIAYKPNRLIIFPGQLLHSTLVDVTKDINADPKKGRLTANMFVEFK